MEANDWRESVRSIQEERGGRRVRVKRQTDRQRWRRIDRIVREEGYCTKRSQNRV